MKITIVASAAVAGAFLALSGAGVAHAGTAADEGGVLRGNQAPVPMAIPVDDCGDATALLGVADAGCAGAEWIAGVSWDGGFAPGIVRVAGVSWDVQGRFASGAARIAGVSWDGGFFSDAEDIGSQGGLPLAPRVKGCGNRVGSATSSCHGGAVERGHRVVPLSAASPCPCDPPPCPCQPPPCSCEFGTCSCGGVSHGHHISRHKPLHHPARHIAPSVATPVVSRAHGAPTPIRGMLPVTGVNLEGITGSAVGLLGTGSGALFGATRVSNRRRRRGPA